MSAPTKCDIIRAGAAATISGKCSGSSPVPECYITDLATKRDMHFRTKYSPSGFISGTARDIRNKKLNIIQGDINGDISQIKSTKYGKDAPTDITWNDFTECRWNSNGLKGGPHGNEYFKRADLTSLGYKPQPLFDVSSLKDRLPHVLTESIPIWIDHAFNPDLAVIIIFMILVVIFAVLIYNAYQWTRKAPEREAAAKSAWQTEMEKHDPYKNTKFSSYPSNPDSKWEDLIPVYEAEGYNMCSYRKKLGMPLKGHCSEGA